MKRQYLFSEREKEVVELLLQGKSNKQIALALGVSQSTVEYHLKNIYKKLRVNSRTEAVLRLGKSRGNDISSELGKSTVEMDSEPADNDGESISTRRIPMRRFTYVIGGLLVIAIGVMLVYLYSSSKSIGFTPTTQLEIKPIASTAFEYPTEAPIPSPTATSPNIPYIPPPTILPTFVSYPSIAFDRTRGELIMFGGTNPPQCDECSETWIWNGENWERSATRVKPIGRDSVGFVYDEARKQAVLFGSPGLYFQQNGSLLNDTWIWDGQNWVEKHPLVSPPARFSGQMGMVYDVARQVVVLFGGTIPNPENSRMTKVLNDTWLWNGENWTQANPSVSLPAPEGIPMAMGYDEARQNIVLLSSGTWIWNGENWREFYPAHSPSAGVQGVMAYDESRQQLVFIGRDVTSVSTKSQTWIWDGNDWIQVETKTDPIVDGGGAYLFYSPQYRGLLLFKIDANVKLGRFGYRLWYWTGNDWVNTYGE